MTDADSAVRKSEMDRMDDTTFNKTTIEYYIGYIKEHFFDPVGVPHDIRPRPNPIGSA